MKVILFILCFSAYAFGQTDVCKEIKDASGTNKISVVPDTGNSIKPIMEAIDNARKLPQYSKYSNVIIEVKEGRYIGEDGIIISPDENTILIGGKEIKFTGRDGICLSGINKPIIKRTKFSGEFDKPVIKISNASNILVKGFEVEGTIAKENCGADPMGFYVVNSQNKTISNIRIEDNFIHTIGQIYVGKCLDSGKKEYNRNKGQAHGINVRIDADQKGNEKCKITDVYIQRNTLTNLRLGSSETITINGNVYNFHVTENTIFDVDNIGVDIIGGAGDKFQATKGTIVGNKIFDLKGGNGAYPFVAGIYIDGGTGSSGEGNEIKIEKNLVSNFGIGVSVGSENDYCDGGDDDPSNDKCKIRTEYVSIENNVLNGNQVYGIGVGKAEIDQNSQTWNCKIVGNTIYGNNLSQFEKGYSELHFGSLEANSLKAIAVKNNLIIATVDDAFLVRFVGVGDNNKPDVTFDNNVFFKIKDTQNLWSWANKSDYPRNSLFDPNTNLSIFPKDKIKGENNYWMVKN